MGAILLNIGKIFKLNNKYTIKKFPNKVTLEIKNKKCSQINDCILFLNYMELADDTYKVSSKYC